MMRSAGFIGVPLLLVASCSGFTEATPDPADASDASDPGAEASAGDGSAVDAALPVMDAADGEAGPADPAVCTPFSGTTAPMDWSVMTSGGTMTFQSKGTPAAQAIISGPQSATISHPLVPASNNLDITIDLSIESHVSAGAPTELVKLVCNGAAISVEITPQGSMALVAGASPNDLGPLPTTRASLRIALNGASVSATLGGSATTTSGTPLDAMADCTLSVGATATTGSGKTTVSYYNVCIQ